jgi:proteasome accessory factor C
MAKRPDTHARARRLLALLPHLHKGDRIPLASLARAVGCSTEEVAADLMTLVMCGVPPFTPFDMVDLTIEGDSVTVHMDLPALDKPLRLTVGEARALGAALEIAGYDAGSPLRAKLHEITTASSSADELERTVRAGAAPGGAAEIYSSLAAAIDERTTVCIVYYTGSSGRVSERVVQPWALVQRLGAWYLVAMCLTAGQERVFRLDRIRGAERTGETFDPPAAPPLSVTPDTAGLRVAEIRFGAGVSLPDETAWPGVALETQADGTTIARMPYQTTSWIARRIVAYLGDAEAIGPEEVRSAVREMAADELSRII